MKIYEKPELEVCSFYTEEMLLAGRGTNGLSDVKGGFDEFDPSKD